MTQYGLSLGQLIQGGLSRGADIYQSGQAMAMQREQMARQAEMDAMRRQAEMDAMRRQAMQQELAQRALAASEYADQREADREFMDLYARTYLADPEAQAPAPRTGMGPADDGAIGLTPPTPATQAMPDWRQLSRASPRVQNLFLEAGENARLTRERAKKERDEFNALIGTGLSRFTGPKEDTPEAWGEVANKYRRAMERGDVTSADVRKHAPRKVVEILDADEESHRARMVDYLTIGRGQNGEAVQDEAEAVLLSGYPTRQLEAMVGSRRAEERKQAAALEQTRVLNTAYAILGDPNASHASRSQAQATLAQLNAPMSPGVPKTDGPVSIANDRTVQSFKALLDLVDTETKGNTGDGDIARRRMAAEAYQAALAGRVTADGWAIINGGQPRADGAYMVVRSDGASGWIAGDELRRRMAGDGSQQVQQPDRHADEAYGGSDVGQSPAPEGDNADRLIDALIDEAIGGGE